MSGCHPPTRTKACRPRSGRDGRCPVCRCLILSQHVEQLYARELLADGEGGVGYQLKDRVFDAEQFMDALERVAGGGTALDPTVVAQLLGRAQRRNPLTDLTERESSVLALMAEGLSNAAIAAPVIQF